MKNLYKTALVSAATVLLAVPALAEETATTAGAGSTGMLGIAAAIAIGVAALGGALAQGKAASAALEGVARNPAASGKLTVPLVLSLALIESLVIYALVIAFQLVPKH